MDFFISPAFGFIFTSGFGLSILSILILFNFHINMKLILYL